MTDVQLGRGVVSWAEHKAACGKAFDAGFADGSRVSKEMIRVRADQLTALQAEHDLARAACDAESDRVLALQARVAELEEADRLLRESLDPASDGDPRATARMAREQREWLARNPSPPPAVGEEFTSETERYLVGLRKL